MSKRYLAGLTALFLSVAIPAHADYVIKDGAGASQTFGSFTLSGVQFPKHVMVDPTTGAAIGVSAAPFFVQVTNFPSTQPISGTVSVSNLPATQPVSGTVSVGTLPALPAGANAIGSVSVSNLPATQAISATALPLPTGAAQDATVTARLGTLGQKAMAGSAPVVIASDQSAVPVTGTFFQSTQPVSNAGTFAVQNTAATPAGANSIGTVGLNAGTNQIGTIGNTAFGISGTLPAYAATPTFNVGTTGGLALDATLTARLGTLGQKASAGSAPVVLATDQSSIPVTVGNFPATQPVSISQATPGTTNGVVVNNQATQTTTGAIAPPTAAAGKITKTSTALTANTSTTVVAANTNRIALAIQCASGGVSVDETGAALTAAGVGNGTLFIPTNTGPYFTPPVATLTAITAYTATAQTCVVTEYLR